MTIAIAARGPHAGLAVFRALRAVERVGTGSVGGFATYVAITEDKRLLRHQTQRGGSRTLFLNGEETGVDPSPEIAEATSAGVISSGPERPDLEKLLVADAQAGLVTGHRIPIEIGVDGVPLNQQTLDFLIRGHSAQEAVDAVMSRNPQSDAGLIAIDGRGQIYGRNSERVLLRPDLGVGQATAERGEASVIVYYNCIRPYSALADLATAIALETMMGIPQPDAYVAVATGLPVRSGKESAIHCDVSGRALHITTADATALHGRQIGAIISLGSPIYFDGKLIGHCMTEMLTTVVEGVLTDMSGQATVPFGYRRA